MQWLKPHHGWLSLGGRNGPAIALCPKLPEAVVPLEGQLRFTRGHRFPWVEKPLTYLTRTCLTMENGLCLNGKKKIIIKNFNKKEKKIPRRNNNNHPCCQIS